MQPERWRQIDQLFHLALDKQRDERELFLAEFCAGDQVLQKEVEELILSHEQAEEFLESPASDLAAELLAKGQAGLKLGDKLGPYEIQSVLGIGGMGEVYLATDTRLGRQVALKILPPRFTLDPERVSRFEKEARAASALNHPNIVTIYEIGQFNNARFIATEFVEGQTLRQLMNEKPFTLNEALNVTIQVAVALTSAHAAGIVHRDIKPENIMLRADGYVKILDFGLAKLTETPVSESDPETPTLLQSNPGLLMGTVQYMSPEQARRKRVDRRTDVWSLGIVLYELLAGRVPFAPGLGSSGAGLIGFPAMANYVAAKHGVLGLTKTAALECAASGIRINAICPGTARSRMVEEWIGGDPAQEAMVAGLHPIGRIADPKEIAEAAIWLCSDAASFVMGHALAVDGGYTIQ